MLDIANPSGKIDIGCGKRGSKYEGFTGIDIRIKPGCGIAHDIRLGLPFDSDSVDEAICLHVLEHMTRAEALLVCQEIYRVLKTGGMATIATPDLRRMATRYLEMNEDFYNKTYQHSALHIWNGPTIADKFVDSICGMGRRGHRYAYDFNSLEYLLKEAGFKAPVGCMPDCKYKTRDHEIVLEAVK